MFPMVINNQWVVIPTFFFMVMLGILTATFYLYHRAPREGLSQVAVLDMGIVGGIFGILGARIFHVLFEYPAFYWEDPSRVFEFWRGGFVSFGAYIGGALALLVYLKVRRLPMARYADFLALSVPFLILFIRLGCLGAGCCYGKPTDFWIHLVFDHPQSDAGSKFPGIPLHATQVYDMLNAVFIFAILHWRYARKRFHGEVVLMLYMLYSVNRSLIEILRGDVDRGVYFNGLVSTGQITSVVFLGLAIGLYGLLYRRAAPSSVLNSGNES